jgi:hypothetical protein
MKLFASACVLLLVGCGGPDEPGENGAASSQVDATKDRTESEAPRTSATRADGVEPVLIETPDGLAVQMQRDGQLQVQACGLSCEDFCQGCLLGACAAGGEVALCGAAAQLCVSSCLTCGSPGAGLGTCGAPACVGDPSCYFRELGIPADMRELATRPGISTPGSNVTPDPNPSSTPNPGAY